MPLDRESLIALLSAPEFLGKLAVMAAKSRPKTGELKPGVLVVREGADGAMVLEPPVYDFYGRVPDTMIAPDATYAQAVNARGGAGHTLAVVQSIATGPLRPAEAVTDMDGLLRRHWRLAQHLGRPVIGIALTAEQDDGAPRAGGDRVQLAVFRPTLEQVSAGVTSLNLQDMPTAVIMYEAESSGTRVRAVTLQPPSDLPELIAPLYVA